MKSFLLLLVVPLGLCGCGPDDEAPAPAPRVSAPEPTNESLRRTIIPPTGTSKADVDAVYGTPRVLETLTSKGNPAYYPMHEYALLPPRSGSDFLRAFLYVTYRDDRVYRAGINHSCVSKNLTIGPGDRVDHAQEERGVKEDLLLIEKTFGIKYGVR
jgi:hypothetical protein